MRVRRILPLSLVTGLTGLLLITGSPAAFAAQPQVGLGTATPYAVLAGTTITNTGPSVISGDLGLSPGSAITGFPPGTVINGAQHVTDAVALQAQNDLVTAYNDAAGRTPVVDETSQDLGGQTLVPGVYQAASAMALTGTVTLDAQGDPNAVFVFQAGSTLITASSSTVALVGGAQACNVFWQVGSSATLGTSTTFVGTVIALTSISLQTAATVQGRVLARNGQVSLDTNTITQSTCANPTTATATPTPSPAGSSGGSQAGGSNAGTRGTGADARGPVVPQGFPETGRTAPPEAQGVFNLPDSAWLAAGIAALGGAVIVALPSRRVLRRARTRRH